MSESRGNSEIVPSLSRPAERRAGERWPLTSFSSQPASVNGRIKNRDGVCKLLEGLTFTRPIRVYPPLFPPGARKQRTIPSVSLFRAKINKTPQKFQPSRYTSVSADIGGIINPLSRRALTGSALPLATG